MLKYNLDLNLKNWFVKWTHLHHLFDEHQLDNKIEFSNGRHRVRMLNVLQLDSNLIIYDARFSWTITRTIQAMHKHNIPLNRGDGGGGGCTVIVGCVVVVVKLCVLPECVCCVCCDWESEKRQVIKINWHIRQGHLKFERVRSSSSRQFFLPRFCATKLVTQISPNEIHDVQLMVCLVLSALELVPI